MRGNIKGVGIAIVLTGIALVVLVINVHRSPALQGVPTPTTSTTTTPPPGIHQQVQ